MRLIAAIIVGTALWSLTPAFAQPSSRASDFVRVCDAAVPSNKCLTDYEEDLAGLLFTSDSKFANCAPDTTSLAPAASYVELRKQVQAIVSWLKAHPDAANAEETAGVGTALHTNYPCPK
jgi:hypothetical protein